MIQKNIIIPYDNRGGIGIPSGFAEETSLNGKFPKGWSDVVLPNVSGGALTHTHTISAHTHTIGAHTHAFTVNTSTYGEEGSNTGIYGIILTNHAHAGGTSGAKQNDTVSSNAPTTDAVNHEPANMTVKFIKALKPCLIPPKGISLRLNTDEPEGMIECTGASSTINLADRFLKGGDAGTEKTTNTHKHTVSHQHDFVHNHADAGSGAATYGYILRNNYGVGNWGFPARNDHLHTVYFANHSATVGHSVDSSTETVEPAYYTVKAFENMQAYGLMPKKGMIGMILLDPTDEDNIPVGWKLCDGSDGTPDLRGKFLKVANTASQTGGSNTHDHDTIAHTHTVNHTHTGSTSTMDRQGIELMRNQSWEGFIRNHTHTVNVTAADFVTNSADIVVPAANNEPPYLTVAYVMFDFPVTGGGFASHFQEV